jgi:protein required for attachment to host cells
VSLTRHVRTGTAGAEKAMIDETTVALVADASRANLFRVEVATGQWTPLDALGQGPSAEDRSHGRNKLEAQRFAKHLAAELARRYDEQVFRRLVVVAPADLMGFLRNEMPKRVAQSVIEERAQDLSHVRPDDLSDLVPLPHR